MGGKGRFAGAALLLRDGDHTGHALPVPRRHRSAGSREMVSGRAGPAQAGSMAATGSCRARLPRRSRSRAWSQSEYPGRLMTHRISPPRPRPSRPQIALPTGACDVHAHVFAPPGVYPYAARAALHAGAGHRARLPTARMLGAIGFERAVLVHSNIYGPDNRATPDALGRDGGRVPGRRAGPARVDERRSRRSPRLGMRGIRINLEFPGEVALDDVESMAPRLGSARLAPPDAEQRRAAARASAGACRRCGSTW